MYLYNDYSEGMVGNLQFTMTDTIKDLPVTNPKISIEKYSLDMVYLGNIYEGYVTNYNDDDLDGYYDHVFTYELPDPTPSEEGYIYVAYDTKDNNIIAAGHLFGTTTAYFKGTFVYDNAIGVNGSPYLNESKEFLFDGDYENYMFNDSNYLITHVRVNHAELFNTALYYYSENTDQIRFVYFEFTYADFCELHWTDPLETHNDTYECYFYASEGDYLPPLFSFLQSSAIAHSYYLTSRLDHYVDDYTNFFTNEAYADNNGVYTYNMVNNYSTQIGETPIYNFDLFNDMELVSHSVKEGGVLRADIEKPETYLDDVYDYQYLYDNNTSVYYFDITEDPEQEVYLEVFLGITPDEATVTYHMKATEDYRNGADNDAYNVSDSDIYEMRAILPFDEKVDDALGIVGLNDTVGKIVFSAILFILATIVGFYFSRNVITTLFIDFLVLALLTVLGIIPTWIMLVILVGLLIMIFMKRKGE